MKKVFIHAYAAANLGDDLLIRCLCERYQKVFFRICADASYKKRFEGITNLKVYAPEDWQVCFWNWVMKRFMRTDKGFWKHICKRSFATVHIGGSVFVQHQEDFSVQYQLDQELCEHSKRICVVGANFGPYTAEEYYLSYRELFQTYEGVCFRDQFSYRLFQELPNIYYAPDVAFNYILPAPIKTKKQVLISVIQLKNRGGKFSISQYEDVYIDFLIKAARKYLRTGYQIKFISFSEPQGDEEAILNLIERANLSNENRVSICSYNQNMEECLVCLQESEIVIGTRFHSIILGWLAGKKVIPIVYDNKTRQLMEDEQIQFYIELEDLEENSDLFLEQMDAIVPHNVNRLKEEACKQFQVLDKILKK